MPTVENRALFLFPNDSMGGAERLTYNLIHTVSQESVFDYIDIFVFAGENTGTLISLNTLGPTTVYYAKCSNEITAIPKFLKFISSKKYKFAFSTHTHLNSLLCVLRRLKLLNTTRLVTREPTTIFEFDCGKYNSIIPWLVRCYGSQNLLIHQTSYMSSSFNKHTNNRLTNKSVVLSNPIDINKIHSAIGRSTSNTAPSNSQINIVWCGRFIEVKRPILAIEVFHSLLKIKSLPRCTLTLIGSGYLKIQIVQKAIDLKVDTFLRMVDFTENPWSYMAESNIGLLTSSTEGFPNVILEMLACNVNFVVSTNCAGDLDLLPDVHLSKNESADTIAALIAETWQTSETQKDHKHRQKMLLDRSPLSFWKKIEANL